MIQMKYRPEIDGLRAIAVLSVVFYHASISVFGWQPFKGGYLGVDVFFVISGYLITGILCRELSEGSFSVLRFYERRARRILPALFTVLAASFLPAWLWLMPDQFANFGESMIWTLGFASNVFFWIDSDYFSEAIALKPLFHTWSLAVEEQFYFLFPPLIWLLHQLRVGPILILSTLAGLSLAAAQWASAVAPDANFYLLPFRGWELIGGALLATAEHRGRRRPSTLDGPAALTCLAGILVSITAFDGNTPHPSIYTVLPVACTMGVIWFAGNGNSAGRLLSTRPMVAIGLISYSLYLWHQPLFAFARVYSIDAVRQPVYLGLVGAAILLAWLSWAFVEQPFRDKKKVPAQWIWLTSAGGMASIAVIAFAITASMGFPSRVPEVVRSAAQVQIGYAPRSGENCHEATCVIGDKNDQPSIAIIGDSHARMLTNSLDRSLESAGLAAIVLTRGDVYIDHFPEEYAGHVGLNRVLRTYKEALEDPRIETIVLSGRYTLRVVNTPFDNREGGVEQLDDSYTGRPEPSREKILTLIDKGIRDLIDDGKKVVLVYPIPEVGWDVPTTIKKLAMRASSRELTTSLDVYEERNSDIIALFDALPETPLLQRVRPSNLFCETSTRRCYTAHDGNLLYHDDDHLSIAGADRLANEIVRVIAPPLVELKR